MNEEKIELEFKRLNLEEGDHLIIKVNTAGLSEEQCAEKLSSIRNDEFVNYIEEQGHKVLVSYTGLDFQILRVNENDKILIYANVDGMDEQKKEQYIDYLNHKLTDIMDNSIIVPVENNSPQIRIQEGE